MKWLFITFMTVAVFVSAIQVVSSQHKSRKLFMEIQLLTERRDDLNEEWGRLQLEQTTWATDDRIETIARTRLGMVMPETENLVIDK